MGQPKNFFYLFLQITQISCYDQDRLAPSGCTQYFTGTAGTIQSFNFIAGNANNYQLANQHQKICFRSTIHFCVNNFWVDLRILFNLFSEYNSKQTLKYVFILLFQAWTKYVQVNIFHLIFFNFSFIKNIVLILAKTEKIAKKVFNLLIFFSDFRVCFSQATAIDFQVSSKFIFRFIIIL